MVSSVKNSTPNYTNTEKKFMKCLRSGRICRGNSERNISNYFSCSYDKLLTLLWEKSAVSLPRPWVLYPRMKININYNQQR